MAERIELFANDGKAPVIPVTPVGVKNPDNPDGELLNPNSVYAGTNLISHGVEEAISGSTVKSILIPETLDLTIPNYVLDFRKATKLRQHQVKALTSIIADDGDTAIYVVLPNGMEKLGMGIGSSLDRVLPAGVQSIFGSACTLFQNVERGKPLRELKQQDINKLRLRL